MPNNLAVLASGTGSLLEAIIESGPPISLVITDRPCRAQEIAKKHGIPQLAVQRTFGKSFDREMFTDMVIGALQAHHIDFVAMAGFMTVFSPTMFAKDAYQLKVLNTHPSLLPSFKGDHAVRDAIAAGVKVSGFTIHFATKEVDDGPILAQEAVKVLLGDTVESLHERIKVEERKLYPELLKLLLID